MKKIPELVKEHTELFVFFFFLITSLFLGDGKQPFVDMWWALGILTMYGVRYYQRGKLDLRPLPRSIGLVWTALIVYYIILTLFSDSAGYSITATVRLIEAYLVYVMFSAISSERTTNLFTKWLLFVGVVATLASFVFLLAPSWASFLPPMNLLYATYGHNHLADLLLFVFPIAIGNTGLLVLFTIGMLLTFARGAWILLVFYLLFLVWRSKNVAVRRVGLLVAAAIIATLLLVALRGIPTQKPSLLADGRWEYWRQAIEAIKERPLFGSGPGTFYLQSKRLQSAPSSYSWFAHSFPLEVAVESGLVGFSLFSVLLYLVFRRVNTNPLLWGTVLVLMYSFYEFTLDYTIMWLLVWVALGALTKHHIQRSTHSKPVIAALVVLALFYVSSIGSLAASVFGNKTLAFFLAPYNTNTTKEFLENIREGDVVKSDTALRVVRALHKSNPEVLFAAIKAGRDNFSGWAYKQALLYDPGNIDKYKTYIRFLIQQNDTRNIWGAVVGLGKQELPTYIVPGLQRMTLTIKPLSAVQKEELTEPLFGAYGLGDRYSKFFYLLGISLIDDNPKVTEELWKLSRDLAPGWAHYHLELAGLYYWKLHDATAAADSLKVCRRNVYAGRYCVENVDNLVLLPRPGTFKDKIVAIPRY
ncbi:O-antigen ligase family protein [Candidatus Gottesmanbacteria bacterium]|nr:O-antigen ligase family protein [Candidatus Gottesmanbacteria bacterium]